MTDSREIPTKQLAARAAAWLCAQQSDRAGRRNRCIVLLYIFAFPGVTARTIAQHTSLSAHQVHTALQSLIAADRIIRGSGEDKRHKLCCVTPSGATYATDTIMPKVGLAPNGLTAPQARRRTYRNVVHPTLFDRSMYLMYRRAMKRGGITMNLDRFTLSLVLYLGQHSTLEATWHQAELYPGTPTRRAKAKHRSTDSDIISQTSVRNQFGAAVRYLVEHGLIVREPDPHSRKTAWLLRKLPALDTLYERINACLRQPT